MNEPKFGVGDRVCIPVEMPVSNRLKGKRGVVVEVLPGTGPGVQPVTKGDKLEWSTFPQYGVDFWSHLGIRRIDEAALERDSN